MTVFLNLLPASMRRVQSGHRPRLPVREVRGDALLCTLYSRLVQRSVRSAKLGMHIPHSYGPLTCRWSAAGWVTLAGNTALAGIRTYVAHIAAPCKVSGHHHTENLG